MTISNYIYSLVKEISESKSMDECRRLRSKLDYARAYGRGANAINAYRDRAIEHEIKKRYRTPGAEIAVINNYTANPDKYTAEYEAYQEFRAECKHRVDARIEVLKGELEAALKN